MELGSIFLILALMLLVALIVSRPFLENKKDRNIQDQSHSTLLAERDQLLRALKELDFDFALGKIPEEDYPSQRMSLLHKGVDILRRIDEAKLGEGGEGVDLQLEAAIAARKIEFTDLSHAPNGNGRKLTSSSVSAAVATPDDELEVLLANRRRDRQDKANGFCPRCGAPNQKLDHFCPKCGAKVAISDA